MNNFLITPIEFLKGVGPAKAELLKKELNIFSFADLLYYYPFRYVDRSEFHKISELLSLNEPAQIKGRIVSFSESGTGYTKRLNAKFQDDTGMVELVWFKGVKWIKSSLKINEEIIVYGKIKQFGNKWNIPHPEISNVDAKNTVKGFQPVYSSTERLNSMGLNSKGFEKIVGELLLNIDGQIEDLLPIKVKENYNKIKWTIIQRKNILK